MENPNTVVISYAVCLNHQLPHDHAELEKKISGIASIDLGGLNSWMDVQMRVLKELTAMHLDPSATDIQTYWHNFVVLPPFPI